MPEDMSPDDLRRNLLREYFNDSDDRDRHVIGLMLMAYWWDHVLNPIQRDNHFAATMAALPDTHLIPFANHLVETVAVLNAISDGA